MKPSLILSLTLVSLHLNGECVQAGPVNCNATYVAARLQEGVFTSEKGKEGLQVKGRIYLVKDENGQQVLSLLESMKTAMQEATKESLSTHWVPGNTHGEGYCHVTIHGKHGKDTFRLYPYYYADLQKK